MKVQQRILIAGYYGYRNTGDEAILSGMLADLQDRIPNAAICVVSGEPQATRKMHGVESVPWEEPREWIEGLRSSSAVIVGGGGVFHDYQSVDFERIPSARKFCLESLASLALSARLLDRPVALLGVGVGPLASSSGRIVTKFLFDLASSASLRDRASWLLLRELGVNVRHARVTADYAFLLRPSEGYEGPLAVGGMFHGEIPRPLLGVALRGWPYRGMRADWPEQIADALNIYLDTSGGGVLFIPFQRLPGDATDDAAIARQVQRRLSSPCRTAVADGELTPTYVAELVGHVDCLLGMRYHSILFAVRKGTPSVAIPYDPKVRDLLMESGLGEFVADPDSLDGEQLGELLAQLALRPRSDPHPEADYLRSLAKRNTDVVIQLLGSPRRPSLNPGPILSEAFGQSSARISLEVQSMLGTRSGSWRGAEVSPPAAPVPDVADEPPGSAYAPLFSAVERWRSSRGVVIMMPTVDWDYMFQRPQQMSRALAKQGFLVIYTTSNSAVDASVDVREVEPRVILTTLSIDQLNVIDKPILYLGRPSHRHLMTKLRPGCVVYDHFDDLDVLKESRDDHHRLLRDADIVIASSTALIRDVLSHRQDSLLIRNGVDASRVEASRPRSDGFDAGNQIWARKGGRQVVGYLGALAEWVDFALLGELAEARPDVDVVMAGVDFDGSLGRSGLLSRKNVYYLGMKGYEDALQLLWGFDVCLIPFLVNKITVAASPVKLFEYMACGKQVVVTDLPECDGFPGVVAAKNRAEFVRLVDIALEHSADNDMANSIRRAAKENTWDLRANALVRRMEEIGAATGVGVFVEGIGQVTAPRPGEILRRSIDANRRLEEERDSSDAALLIAQRETDALAVELASSRRELEQGRARERSLDAGIREATERSEERQERLEKREAELQAIHTSRHWRAMSAYWATRDRIRLACSALRHLLRRAIPYTSRRSIVLLARRAGLSGPSSKNATDLFRRDGVQRSAKVAVLFFPVIDWDFRFQRPQHLATQFAAANHNCYYMVTGFRGSLADLESREVAHNVHELRLPGPAGLDVYKSSLSLEASAGMLAALARLKDLAGIDDALCIVQLPFWAPLARAARQRWGWKLVYDCMDEHSGFSTNSPRMLGSEDELLKSSDLVLTSSQALFQKASARARNVLHLPNGTDYEHFSGVHARNPLAELGHPIVGYYGAIAEWFDAELIRCAAQQRPDWQFVLIGDTSGGEVGLLRGLSNVHLLGEMPYGLLPAYLHAFDVACIPFKLTPLTRATNPVKFYEYLSAGKPVVSVALPDLEPLQNLFYRVASPIDFVPQIENALREWSPEREWAAKEFAKANTWEARFRTLQPRLRALFGRAAIVVVSLDNVEYTRLCLESIWEKTAYPNFEVIVVDNGSRPDVVSELRGMAAVEPRLRLVENGHNLGFAKANNIGINAAGDCSYIVLLNNDTVVTRGWLTRLIRHLDDPEVALVGPVSNWVGNEAQVPVDYRSIEGMESFAESYTRNLERKTFEIPMLAMFCVAMRRSLLDEIGMLDERFGLGLFEDDDFSLRVKQVGGRILCAEDVFVHHWGQASFAALPSAEYDRLFQENRRKYETKWGQEWVPHRQRA